MPHLSLLTLVLRLAGVILAGTVFFRWAEGWGWIDSYYFTVVTISTVGYGDLTPATDLGKIGATVLIFVGLGVFALTLQQVTADRMEHRQAHPRWILRLVRRIKDTRARLRPRDHDS